MDIATCTTEKNKLEWIFKLFDVDNNGVIDVKEMAAIMETMEKLEYRDIVVDSDNADDLTPLKRAQNLFNCLDHENEGTLTKEEFIEGYLERNTLLEKQDAQEQKIRLEGLVFRGPLIHEIGEVKNERLPFLVEKLLKERAEIKISPYDDIGLVQLREPTENYPRSLLVRFHEEEVRNHVWNHRQISKRNGLIFEEWLTENRARLYRKCKELKLVKRVKDCYTENGDVFVMVTTQPGIVFT